MNLQLKEKAMSKERRAQIEALVNIHVDAMIDKISALASILDVNISNRIVSNLKSYLLILAIRYDKEIEPFNLESIDTTETMRIIDRLFSLTIALLNLDEPANTIETIMEDPGYFKQTIKDLPSYYEMEEEERDEQRFKDIITSFNLND
jgi:hypothetical protein